MPNPTVSDVHINAPLTNVAVKYAQQTGDFLSDKVFPTIPSDKRSDLFWRYSKSDWRRTDAKKRAPGTESAGIGWRASTDNFYCDVYAAHKDIDDQTRANADSNFKLDKDSTELVISHLLLRRELDWTEAFFKPGVWANERSGVDTVGAVVADSTFLQFDQAASDPLAFHTDLETEFRRENGMGLSFCVMGADVWKAYANHPAILDRIKYTQKGVITKDLVASFIGVPNLYVAYASLSTGPQINDMVLQDAAATYDWIASPKSMLLGYAPDSPSTQKPSAGYTFKWSGYGAGNRDGITMSSFRMQEIKSDRIEGEQTYSHKIVSPDCGIFINNAVA